jgi:hypothetical protein
VCVYRFARVSDQNINVDSKFLLASIIGGSLFFYGCIAYSAENYLSMGFWLAIPFVVGTVVSNSKILLMPHKTIGLVGLIGAISGTIGYWMVQQSNAGDFFTAARIMGRGGLQLIVGIIFIHVFSLLKGIRIETCWCAFFFYFRLLAQMCIGFRVCLWEGMSGIKGLKTRNRQCSMDQPWNRKPRNGFLLIR